MKNLNLMNALNGLNSELGLNSATGNKYDYLNAGVETEKQRKTFRIDQRKKVKNFYESDKLDLQFLKNFVTVQTNILLVCTKDKKSFANLSITEIYPNFDKLSANEQNLIKIRHAKIISVLYPKDKKDVKKDVKNEVKKVLKPKAKKEVLKPIETEKDAN